MPRAIDRDEVQRQLEDGAQLVEVLTADDYDDEHLPGAINIPLKRLEAEGARRLDRDRPVIVYCYDYQCDLSPRAAAWLERLGFTAVYDYVAGKADWGSFGLPLVGRRDSATRAGAHARTDVPAVGLGTRLGEVRDRVRGAGWDTCFVVDPQGVVLGRLGRAALEREDDVTAEEAMAPGPRTVRPSFGLGDAVKRMDNLDLTSLPVTHSDGVLVGVLRRDDAERALERKG
jgi:rhodanese-related sulfurtransferase/CBS domain-containing protein